MIKKSYKLSDRVKHRCCSVLICDYISIFSLIGFGVLPLTHAETVNIPTVTQPLENLDQISSPTKGKFRAPDEEHKQMLQQNKDKQTHQPVALSDEDVKNNPQLAEIIINTAIQQRDWKTLEKVLPFYQQSAQHDPMLVLYAQGAILRQKGKYTQAIQQYQQMLHEDPSLDYVKFDLGAMLFENRQYRDAEKIFIDTHNNQAIDPNFRILADQFLNQIKLQESVNGKARLRLIYNDNVNQSSPQREIELGNGFIATKSEDQMPKSSFGTNYNLNFEQDYNIKQHHFLNWTLALDGLNYTSAHAYDEHSIRFNPSYKWQDVKSWFYVGPTIEWRWLGRQQYMNNHGISTGYGRWLSPYWQATIYGNWLNKNYQDDKYSAFSGDSYMIAPGVVRLLSADSAIFAGLSFQKDKLESRYENFKQNGINAGFIKQWKNGLNAQLNAQFSVRKYQDSLLNREEKRFNAFVNLGYKKFNFGGVEPKLGYLIDDVKSNYFSDIYSRRIQQWMLTFEKKF